MSYIDANDLVFNNDPANGIHSGGFNVNSLFMKRGISPIVTLNKENIQHGGNLVSDIFNDLVVPNWALYNPGKMTGGSIHRPPDSDSNSDSEDEAIDDNLHDQLLDIVKHQENVTNLKKKNTKKGHTRNKNKITKKITNKPINQKLINQKTINQK